MGETSGRTGPLRGPLSQPGWGPCRAELLGTASVGSDPEGPASEGCFHLLRGQAWGGTSEDQSRWGSQTSQPTSIPRTFESSMAPEGKHKT